MTTLKKLWIEHTPGGQIAIRIDWKNDRHQMITIKGDSPEAVERALIDAGALVAVERIKGNI